jgi:signal transduction histidine kinase
MVAHDLRSPIRIVSGYAELLLSRWDRFDEATRREYLETILRSARNSYALIDDVLEVARIESGDLGIEAEPYDLEALVRGTAAEATLPGSAIDVRVDGPLPAAYGDRRRHWQVLGNLLANAVRYSPPDRPPEISITTSGDVLEVAVRDHGPGIRPEDEPRLFQRFSRIAASGDEAGTGTGLGLYITRSLVEAQGGRVWVESTPGEGSTFRFTVPVAAGAGASPERRP